MNGGNILPVGQHPMATSEAFTTAWHNFRLRWQERDERMDRIARIVRGDWTVLAPDDEELISRSPNMVQVALDDTAEASSLMPTIRVDASSSETKAKEDAAMMERLGMSYMDRSEFPLLSIKSFLDLYAYGLFTWVVTCNSETGPKLEWRDPRTCYPEPDFSSLSTANRVFFARDLYLTQLPPAYQMAFYAHFGERDYDAGHFTDNRITLVEYYDEQRVVVAGVYNASAVPGATNFMRAEPNYVSVILDDYENPLGICPAIIGQDPDLDPEPHGQFDQVVNILLTHIQMMALVLDNADDTIYAPIWAKDVIGPLAQGGRTWVQLGPQGAIGRIPPASPSFSLFNELQQLVDAFHLGARWPKTRPGDVSQSQASGKFVESTVGMLNTVIKTGHTVMKRALEQAQQVMFRADKLCGPKRTVAGVLRNRPFLMDRDVNDIDLQARVRVDYGLGFGRDPAQSAVLAIQYHGAGFISTETVQESIEGIVDVGLEKQRLLLQQVRDMMLAKTLQMAQGGQVPDTALVDMHRAIQKGDDIAEVFEKFIAKPQEELAEQQIPSALGGGMLTPGPGALPPGAGAAPPAPPPEELLAGLLGGAGGGAPSSIGRLSVPLGDGGFAGTESRG